MITPEDLAYTGMVIIAAQGAFSWLLIHWLYDYLNSIERKLDKLCQKDQK